METITSGAIKLTWDPEARVALIRFESETHATGRDAQTMIEALSDWLGEGDRPFGLLGDGGKLGSVDAEYRALWGRFMRRHRENALVAFYNMSPVIRVAANMFGIGLGLKLKAFAGEQQARAWLREMGIPA